jgi:2-oxoisovalerate dehydrogenase E2 component (dihydrolipoyl transacylase)
MVSILAFLSNGCCV